MNLSEKVKQYIDKTDWLVKENSNTTYSIQGLNNYLASAATKDFWLNEIYPKHIRNAHLQGDLHIHDLNILAVYCVGWDLQDLLCVGFSGVPGKATSKPAKHFRTALLQIVNFFFTLQGEAAGAQAFSNIDTLLAPFIAYDNLDYKEVKQAMQEFVFNLNVPTRVGFQCMSEDTEILTPEGWKKYNEVKTGNIIKTFNLEKQIIEDKPVYKIFNRHYEGKMYNLKNRIQDQLISPKHRVVRKLFNSEKYVLEPIEDVSKLKSNVIVPIGANNNNPNINMSDEQIKLVAWLISDGTLEKNGSFRRITLYKSQIRYPEQYKEILKVLDKLNLDYTTQEGTPALGNPVDQIRFNSETSKKILGLFDHDGIKEIPSKMLNMSQKQSETFVNAYLTEGDGNLEEGKIYTTSEVLVNQLQQITTNAGLGSTVLNRGNTEIGTKDVYVIRIIKHQDTYISDIEEVEYSGIIWCPNTENETVIARRNGKVFITGNTPFTNLSFDLKCPKHLADQSIVIGGIYKEETYGQFQKEIDMFNKAFLEIMSEGDADGRVFTFPIPTYSITKDFDWDNPVYESLWEATAKYGIPYFSNFINSDMSPEDVRSMCCRLRIDNTELRKRGGGLFGANPLTGSVGVVTINLPRIGYTSKSEKEFYNSLERLMDIGFESLNIKRKVLEELTDKGLYPYARYYLRDVKNRFGEYWKNHFSTIGLVGMNESCLNFLGENLGTSNSQTFSNDVMDFMRGKLLEYQQKTGDIWNLEATPAEGTTYRLAKIDVEKYPDIVTAANKGGEPFYTNSTHLPVGYTNSLFKTLELQDELQCKYTGGTVLHAFLGQKLPAENVPHIIHKVFENFKLPYFTLTPTFSICLNDGYLAGEYWECPHCKAKTEVYSRVTGYLTPVDRWNEGKANEFKHRKTYENLLN